MSDALRLDGVSKRYGDLQAVAPLDLAVATGSVCGLLGPNGAGKTTTIRMIMDIIKPDTGSITLLGETDPELRRDRIGYLPEERGIYRRMKVRELLIYFARLRRVSGRDAGQQADYWLDRFELGDRALEKVEALSKGNAQKVQFIACVLHKPEAIILDEPFSGFDPVNVDLVKNVMKELQNEGTTILLSTHQMETVEKLCDTICLIHHGEKVLDGSLRQIKSERGSKLIQLSFDGEPQFLRDGALVSHHTDQGHYVEVMPMMGVSPQAILERAQQEVTISRFEVMEPSLHQIFVETVQSRGDL